MRLFLLLFFFYTVLHFYGEVSCEEFHIKTPVIALTDVIFEDKIKASSGMTAGDWLVLVYSINEPNGLALRDIWRKLSTELSGKVNVAWIEVTDNPQFQKRFTIARFPSILLFRRGTLTFYHDEKTFDSLKQFALGNGDFQKQTIVILPEFTFKLTRFKGYVLHLVWITLHSLEKKRIYYCLGFLAGCITLLITPFAIISCRRKYQAHKIQKDFEFFKDA